MKESIRSRLEHAFKRALKEAYSRQEQLQFSDLMDKLKSEFGPTDVAVPADYEPAKEE